MAVGVYIVTEHVNVMSFEIDWFYKYMSPP